jgi:adenosylcobinamide-phosphate synthase
MNIPDFFFSPCTEVLLLAIILDIIFQEPTGAIHPVVWMGKGIRYLQELPFSNKKIHGIFLVVVMIFTSFIVGIIIVITAQMLPETVSLLILAFFLKSTFSFRMLLGTGWNIMNLINSKKSLKAQEELRALVSRDTTGLDKPHMVCAVIESISENFVDTILSPLLYYLILGVPGALAYKSVNTLDSMVGYKNTEFIELGWASAKLDDALNWIPARLSLIFITLASFFVGNPKNTITVCIRDRALTSSPNSGWPMAATSGALSIQLEKPGEYKIGREFVLPDTKDIENVIKLITIASMIIYLMLVIIDNPFMR